MLSSSFVIHVNCFRLISLVVFLLIGFGKPNDMLIHASNKPEPGSNFGKGSIDLGGLIVSQSSEFDRVWSTDQAGPNDQGATFYEPSSLPDGYFILGHYSHDINKSHIDPVVIVKDDKNGAVAKPLSYELLWSSEESKMKQINGIGYVWQPVAPKGYMALGHIVTATPEMPSLDKVRCVRSEFVEECSDGVSTVPLGTFKLAQSDPGAKMLEHCLKNSNDVNLTMPSVNQIKALMGKYGPLVYFHPAEIYFPSSVDWFFNNGVLLYQRGREANPVRVNPTGSNLPQGGFNDGAFWLDLPIDRNARDHVMRGDLRSVKPYVHVKTVQAGMVTDLALWFLYPYNGPATVKFLAFNIHLGQIGSHVSDWEHVTLRINNLDGKLQSVFFGAHGGGQWVSASQLEYTNGNKPIAYSSLNGHAMFSHGGLVVQGNKRIGLRNDMARSNFVADFGANFEIVSAGYLGIVEPPWLNYAREWGPKINYDIQNEIRAVEKVLIFAPLKREFEKFVNSLPRELLGQEGPVGPKMKASWNGGE